jgi:CARDB
VVGPVPRKILPVLALVAILLGTLVAARGEARLPRTSARLSACHFSSDPLDRSFDLTTRIRPIIGTKRMAIRFDAQVLRPGASRWVDVRAAGFRTWLKSARNVGAYERFRTVNGLEAPARYRVKVGFRWYRRSGRVLKTTWRLTRTCVQGPDLRVRAFVVKHRSESADDYRVVMHNTGTGSTGPFSVSFRAPNGDVTTKHVAGLAPNAYAGRTFTGPRCRRGAATVTIDSHGDVDELQESDNRVTAACGSG